MAGLVVGATFNSRRLQSSCVARLQLVSVAASPSCRFKVSTSFTGQHLRTKSRINYLSSRRSKTAVVKAHQNHPTLNPGPVSPNDNSPVAALHIMDDLSHYIYRKLCKVLEPYFPKDFDALDWLPDSIHNKLHKSEYMATLIVREILHFGLFYCLFINVDRICKWLNWMYITNTKSKEVVEEHYDQSSFKAMADPLRLVVLIWALTRMAHLVALALKIGLEGGLTGKIRSIGLIVSITWFFFNWKSLYVDRLVSTYRLDAPRIFAFDKVVSLIMYFVAASCIGEITGFALRSLLAVGGFSGIALGLAAKEIVSNFFGGAVLFTTRPFVIGERIKAGSFSGIVQDIGFLQTKILSLDRMPMIVPNQAFINQVITNYSRANNKLLDATFPIRIQDIAHVDRITSRVLQYLRAHPDVDVNKSAPVCYLKSFNSSGIDIAVSCVLRPSGGSEYYRVQQAILVYVAEIITLQGAAIGGTAPFNPQIPDVAVRTPGHVE